ncbi:MAG: PAS domain S-box protein [Spirochaetales bacterium]|nr:PAS domain S-box protein [Spirochaetales bacterium]
MRKFLERALEKIDKMDHAQVRGLVVDLAAESELLGMVMESMSDGVVVTDRSDRILLVNKSAERMLPFAAEELTEKVLWEAIGDQEIAAFLRETLHDLDRIVDKEFTLDGGYTRTLSLSMMPLVRRGSIQGTVIHIEDITERKARDARLRRAESLAALTTLTAGVAHEIKNPLGSIGIHLELMKKEMSGKQQIETAKVMENLLIIKEELERLNRIVMDFLFTVRPMNTELEFADLNRLIQELLELLGPELEQAGIQTEIDLVEPAPEIRMDERYMKQAVLNIVKNAISAMPEGGSLGIRTAVKGNHLRLQISDTGIGIPDENMDKIFEPYFTTKEFGSGLGLTIVYKIVKEHLGDIAVDSKVDGGTSFTLSFPIPQKEKRLIGYREESR